jgi:Ca2+-binding RTX toxin-like protein
MARTGDPDSATSQFYVNLSDNRFLDYSSPTKPGYAVFGQIIAGMNVIDNIAKQPTQSVGLLSDVPVAEITITAAIAATAHMSNVGNITVAGVEAGAKWAYSTNNGSTWIAGKGTGFRLAEGTYVAGSIKVRQTDKAGNISASSEIGDATLIVDRTAPLLTVYGPGNLMSDANPIDDIVITFSEGVLLGGGVIKLKNKLGIVVESFSVVALNDPVFSYTVNPSIDLAYGAVYSLDIRSLVITDIAGNKQAGSKKALSFTTTDTITTSDSSYKLGTECNKLTYSGTASFIGYGNDVANTIKSGSGGSRLFGLAGNDLLFGGTGVDVLYGGVGSDTITSGSGNDYFVLSSPADKGTDLFVDFAQGEDKIAFVGKSFLGLPSTLVAGDLLVSAGATKPTSGQHLIYNSTSGALYYDADGLVATPAIKLAIVGKLTHPVLVLADFFIG